MRRTLDAPHFANQRRRLVRGTLLLVANVSARLTPNVMVGERRSAVSALPSSRHPIPVPLR
jgi:hypothetical protein